MPRNHQDGQSVLQQVVAVQSRVVEKARSRFKAGKEIKERFPFVGTHRQVPYGTRVLDIGSLQAGLFPHGVDGAWPCDSAYGGPPDSGWPTYPIATAAPGGGIEQWAQALPTYGQVALQGVLGPGSTKDAVADSNWFVRIALANLEGKLSVPTTSKRTKILFGADVQVTGYTELAVPAFVKPAGTGLIWLDLSLEIDTGNYGKAAAHSLRVVNRQFDSANSYDTSATRLNQRFGVTAEVTDAFQYIDSIGEVTMRLTAILSLSITTDANFVLGANFSSVMNDTADNGGVLSVPGVCAFVYC